MDLAEKELWRRADACLDQLLDLGAEQRAGYLEGIADPALRKRVAGLLAAHEAADGPLDQPLQAPPLPAMPATLAGRRLGRWRLHEEIGRGGMAVVYRAVAEEALIGQQAAVKVLSLGVLARQGQDRFLLEQQTLLRLRHPYLVSLYDAGVADDGTAWLAMALVDGEPIDQWCERQELDVKARVGLVLQVCEALAYTHRNLVIHRDIKPSNVLVDADGHVRVLDFGIARQIDDGRELTATLHRACTPDYAAPEQIAGQPPSTAMDVYGTGALLYRLLTGVTPQRLGLAGQRPLPLPSRATTGAGHVTARPAVAWEIRGDLDTVVMKALAEQPEQRYGSIEGLSEDLKRWLAGQPVLAHPPSWRYRLRKYVGRNRVPVAAAALIGLAVLAGGIATLWQAGIARDQAAKARAEAEVSQAQLAYLDSLLQVLAPSTEQARDQDRSSLVAEAVRRARNELGARPRSLASVELSLARVAEKAGDYPQAAALYDSAHARRQALFGDHHVDTAEALAYSGAIRERLDPPQAAEAERRLQAAVGVLRRDPASGLRSVQALQALASLRANQDRYVEAQAALTEASALCDMRTQPGETCEGLWMTRGSMLARMADTTGARDAFKTAYDARARRLGEEHAETLVVATQLGRFYHLTGERARGLALLERILATQQRIYTTPTQETLATLQALATILVVEGKTERALELRQRQLAQARTLLGDKHPDVALSHADLGSLYFSEARFVEAEQAQRAAHAIYADYAGADGAAALIVQGNLAEALREQGRAAEALPLAREALRGLTGLFGADSRYVAARQVSLARIESDLGQPAQARQDIERAIDIYRNVAPDELVLQTAAVAKASILLAQGQVAQAEAGLRNAVAAIDANPGRTDRSYWEAHAYLLAAACRNHAADCRDLRARAAEALRQPMPSIAHKRLADMLAASPAR